MQEGADGLGRGQGGRRHQVMAAFQDPAHRAVPPIACGEGAAAGLLHARRIVPLGQPQDRLGLAPLGEQAGLQQPGDQRGRCRPVALRLLQARRRGRAQEGLPRRWVVVEARGPPLCLPWVGRDQGGAVVDPIPFK